jgi:V-type H+-transporting ATPase subunit a
MQFINSFKMKLAVIIGVVHMTLGIFLRGVNSYKKTNYYDIITVVIPQVIFIFITFVYMDFLIILKWLKEWKKT